MTIDMNIKFDRHATEQQLKERWQRGITVAASELRRYSNQYVRFLTGKMKDSSYMSSDLSNGLVIWDTPYAHYAYENKNNTHITRESNKNPNAMDHWADYAIKHHLKEIERTVQKEVRRA